MRKHFLILMLLTLLPLAGWAEDYYIYPQDYDKTYGSSDPNLVSGAMFTCVKVSDQSQVTGAAKTTIAGNLDFVRLTAGEDVNATGYAYRLKVKSTYQGDDSYFIQGQAKLYINPLDLSTANPQLTLVNTQCYIDNNTKVQPTLTDFTITVGGFAVAPASRVLAQDGSDYTITGYGGENDNKSVGDATGKVTITGTGNFTGSKELTFAISGIDISGYTVQYIGTTSGATLTYKGEAWTPVATDFLVKKGNTVIPATSGNTINWQIKVNGYTINNTAATYKDNVNAGTGYVKIEGVNNYSGELEASFTINKYAVPANGLTIVDPNNEINPTYTGVALKPNINPTTGLKVTANNLALIGNGSDPDYTITTTSVNAGSATATLTFTDNGNFSGSPVTIPYTINKRSFDQTLADGKKVYLSVNQSDKTYTGSAITPQYTLKVANQQNAYALQKDVDFTIIETNNTNVGAANAATIKFVAVPTGNFEGETVAYTYTIKPATLSVYPNDINTSFGSSVTPSYTVEGWKTTADQATGYTVLANKPVTYKYTGINQTQYNESSDIPTAVGTYSIALDDITGLQVASGNYTFAKKQVNNADKLGTLTISAGEVVLKVADQTIKYGQAAAAYDLEYVSGLSTAAQDDFNNSNAQDHGVTNVSYKLYDSNGDAVNGNVYELSKGTYTIKAERAVPNTPFGYTGYNVIISDGTLTIEPRDINDVNVAIVAPTFDGTAKEPALTVTLNVNNAPVNVVANNYVPYTAAYSNNIDATIDAEAAAQIAENALPALPGNATPEETAARNAEIFAIWSAAKAKVTLTAKANSNFTGTKEVLFSINKKLLNITANDGTWKYGDTEPTDTWTATVNMNDLVLADKSLNLDNATSMASHKFFGTLGVKRTNLTGSSVGEYYNNTPADPEDKLGLIPTGLTATNYAIVANAGKLTITKGDLVLKVKNYDQPYGEAYAPAVQNFKLEYADGLTDPAKIAAWEEVVDLTGVTYEAIDPADNTTVILPADVPTTMGSTVKLKATGATSTNYNITYQMGTYTIVKRPIAFTVSDQALAAFGDDIVRTADKVALANNYSFKDGDDIPHLLASGNLKFEVVDDALMNPTNQAQVDVIRVTLTHDKYVLSEVDNSWGDLTVPAAPVLTLDPTDATLVEKLDSYNGASHITIKLAKRVLKANTWYTMVLPFEVETTELVQSLKGHTDEKDINDEDVRNYNNNSVYAIVNRLGDSTADKVNFKLEMNSIPANEPFLIKTAKDVDFANPYISFVNKTIDYNAEPKAEASGVEYGGNEFIGTYTAIAAADLNYNTTDRHFAFLGNSSYTGSKGQALSNTWYNATLAGLVINPMEAYLHYSPEKSSAAAPMVTIEDFDFETGTTAIKTLNVDTMKAYAAEGWYTLDGIKLQSVPTEKGVYINNGKKVVIK